MTRVRSVRIWGLGALGVVIASLGGCAGCHEEPEESDDPGASSSTGTSETTTDVCALEVTSLTPSPDSEVATPRSTITIQLSHAVDPASVTAESVRLRERESKRIVPTSAVVNGDSIVLTPLRPLGTRGRYTVDVQGVAGSADASCTVDYSARFFTVPNFETSYYRYVDGALVRVHSYTWDQVTRERRVAFLVPGADGEIFTADDVQSGMTLTQYDDQLDQSSAGHWVGPGVDAIWATSDDLPLYMLGYGYGPAGRLSYTSQKVGPDGVLGTPDDLVDLETFVYDEDDRLVSQCNGARCIRSDYSTDGEVWSFTHVGAGPDGQWLTQDDVLAPMWSRAIRDTVGVQTGVEVYALPADGVAVVSLDSLLERYVSTIEDGLTTVEDHFTGPGQDGIWLTADDVGADRSAWVYDADGLQVTRTVHLAGPDATLGTADDALYEQFNY